MVFKKKQKPDLTLNEGENWATASSPNLLSGEDLDKTHEKGWVFVSGFKTDSGFEYVFVRPQPVSDGSEQAQNKVYDVVVGSKNVKVAASSQQEAELKVLQSLGVKQ